MKSVTKCHLYFGSIALLSALCLFNYLLTHSDDGFIRMQSLSLDLQKFYCYKEINQFESCKNEVSSTNYNYTTLICEQFK